MPLFSKKIITDLRNKKTGTKFSAVYNLTCCRRRNQNDLLQAYQQAVRKQPFAKGFEEDF